MRTEPYTTAGVRRVPCTRCSKPSRASWNVYICADKARGRRRIHALCRECDVELNTLVMRFMFGDSREADIAAYAEEENA